MAAPTAGHTVEPNSGFMANRDEHTPTTRPLRPRRPSSARWTRWLERPLAALSRRAPASGAGRTVGRFELDALLSRGGMGEVWTARDRESGRPAAIKFLRTDARAGSPTWEAAAERFRREAAIMGALPRRSIAAVYDAGTDADDTPYYAMELVRGSDLGKLVGRQGPWSAARAADTLARLCRALGDAHAAGVVHRDLKPTNVMVDDMTGDVKLIDFGIARALREDARLTQTNAVVGTPPYMAPETVTAPHAAGPLADIYAVGCIAYYLVTGHPPFDGSSVTELLYKHVHEAPPPLPASVPADLRAIIEDCLAKDPAHRPQSAAELADRFDALATWDHVLAAA